MLPGHYYELKFMLSMAIAYGEGYPWRRIWGKRYLLKIELASLGMRIKAIADAANGLHG